MNKKVWMSSNRSFGLVFFAFFLIIGLWPIFEYEKVRIWSIIAALIFLILGILDSKYLTPLNRFWMKFGLFLGKIISPIVMGIVFFLVVTPIGILMKIFGKDLLNTKYKKNESYWVYRKDKFGSMKRQF
tara:strand:- start:1271 stop:1657 length:387 start_codon:yes stop_codon:yes gene_type:complete